MKNVKKAVLEFIRTHKETSYVELEDLFDQIGFDWAGDYATGAGSVESPHLVTWMGWNAEAFTIINELLDDDLIERVPVHPIIYYMTGKELDLPIARTIADYKEPHWLPIAFSACKPEKEKRK